MADIFISYSQQDRDEAHLLAAFLEAHGYSVWWDHCLMSGDKFRSIIMMELALARAVIVIWTATSTKSDWVQSEAGRAQADRKIIPVKVGHIDYKDIPPPFDVLHTENTVARDKILAAVVAQLARPQVAAPTLWIFSKTIRYEFLGWVGAIGTALTLLNAIGPILQLADWVHYVVDNWVNIVVVVWRGVLSVFNLEIEENTAVAITSNLFVLSLAFASRRRKSDAVTNATQVGAPDLLRGFPILFLMSLLFVISSKPVVQDPTTSVMLVYIGAATMISVFLFVLLVPSYWLIKRASILGVTGGIIIMIVISPIATLAGAVITGSLYFIIYPEALVGLEQLWALDWSDYATLKGFAIAFSKDGILFAVIFAGPLAALLFANRRRLYVRIFRAFGILGLVVVLNYLSIYYPAVRAYFGAS